jgi:cytoskeleton protein RodZ
MEQTIGQQLKEIRESRGITLEEIAENTRIRLVYLRAIEENDLEVLPSPMQMRGFLRLYANELDVEIEDLKVEGYHLFAKSEDKTPSPDVETTAPSESEVIEPQEIEAEVDKRPEPYPDRLDLPTENESQADEPVESFVSSDYFIRIGEKLQQRRNLLSLSLEDIKSNLHIRKKHIESIESGHFENLPSPVQAKGMLANYAEFLNMDVDSILLEYAEGLQIQRLEKAPALEKKNISVRELSSTSLKLRNFFSLDLLVIAVIFIGFAAFVIWGVNRIIAANSPETAATSLPEVADVLLATSSPTVDITSSTEMTTPSADNGETAVVTEAPLFTSAVSANTVNLVIVPLQRVWVQVSTDSELVFEGRLIPGNAYDYSGTEKVEILTGNAGAIQIFFNDQDLGSMGLIGQIANLVFTREGLLLPTATVTPTPTEAPQTTPTQTLTPTISPTLP